ncbi:MAG TPA: YggU family protein [Actinobacteria bacterium]|nr:YggU family protein [Actinomycetota bacterium]
MLDIKEHKSGIVLPIYVQIRSSRAGISEVAKDCLKIRVCSLAKEGKANRETVKILAKLFKVPKSKISILSGETARHKRILIQDVSKDYILMILEKYVFL